MRTVPWGAWGPSWLPQASIRHAHKQRRDAAFRGRGQAKPLPVPRVLGGKRGGGCVWPGLPSEREQRPQEAAVVRRWSRGAAERTCVGSVAALWLPGCENLL